jgi:hypothetical protein
MHMYVSHGGKKTRGRGCVWDWCMVSRLVLCLCFVLFLVFCLHRPHPVLLIFSPRPRSRGLLCILPPRSICVLLCFFIPLLVLTYFLALLVITATDYILSCFLFSKQACVPWTPTNTVNSDVPLLSLKIHSRKGKRAGASECVSGIWCVRFYQCVYFC